MFHYGLLMKDMNHENILIGLAGATLALCLAGSALMTVPEAVAGRTPVHEALRRSTAFVPGTLMEMQFDITAYCPGSCCNSAVVSENGIVRQVDWSGRVAAGDFSIKELMSRGVNIAAVDPAVIPYGSIIEFGGRSYIALDTGSAIRGRRIDILLPEHGETVDFGVRRGETVKIVATGVPGSALAELRRIIDGNVR